jgi:hypothetical protein
MAQQHNNKQQHNNTTTSISNFIRITATADHDGTTTQTSPQEAPPLTESQIPRSFLVQQPDA